MSFLPSKNPNGEDRVRLIDGREAVIVKQIECSNNAVFRFDDGHEEIKTAWDISEVLYDEE